MEESVQVNQGSWLKVALKDGIILGVIHIIIFLLLYALFPSKLTGMSYVFVILVVNFGFVIYRGIQWRNSIGGFMGFGGAFKYAFMLLLFNGILQTIFTFIFVQVDTSLPDLMAQSQLDTSVYWAEKFGAPEESIEQMREKFNPEDVTKRFSLMGMITGLGFGVILYAIGGLIMGLFIRKNPPEMM